MDSGQAEDFRSITNYDSSLRSQSFLVTLTLLEDRAWSTEVTKIRTSPVDSLRPPAVLAQIKIQDHEPGLIFKSTFSPRVCDFQPPRRSHAHIFERDDLDRTTGVLSLSLSLKFVQSAGGGRRDEEEGEGGGGLGR